MKYLTDLWDSSVASRLERDPLELLCYRSNLLGADLRITNFGGGNTSSKYTVTDPFSGQPTRVMAVKGSGGDLGSIRREGFAILYLQRLEQLKQIYRGESAEDEMVEYYPLCTFGRNPVASSIDTPLHAFLPFDHVDHLHPDWAIAMAASANGKQKMEEFNRRFHRHLIWLPWQRPGFELGLMLQRSVEENPHCDGIVLGGHGLFTWGSTQRECYQSSISLIDQLGEFVLEHQEKLGKSLFGGARIQSVADRKVWAADLLPFLRGKVGAHRRSIGHFDDSADVLEFVNSQDAEPLARLGTSCPDHFLRTKICPLYVDFQPEECLERLQEKITAAIEAYRKNYQDYYRALAGPDSPPMREAAPTVILIPGIGLFSFGKNKKEARITSEFYINAIHVMAGATAMDGGTVSGALPIAKRPEDSSRFAAFHNYVALPPAEAFRIEYWALEEAKLRQMPPEREFSRKVFLVVGGGSGIGRATVLQLARHGAHLVVADLNEAAAAAVAQEAAALSARESVSSCGADLTSRESLAAALRHTVLTFGGIDGVINTAAVFVAPDKAGRITDSQWQMTLQVNIAGNYYLADEACRILREQALPACLVLTGSANAVVPKRGSEAYDVSKSALSHLVRELACGLAPLVRVNGIAPATVVAGSTMFPRDRVISSLSKYSVPFDESQSTEELRRRLADFYARRTLTGLPIQPEDCAEAICWLASERSLKTTGHMIPVDGGLAEAFLR